MWGWRNAGTVSAMSAQCVKALQGCKRSRLLEHNILHWVSPSRHCKFLLCIHGIDSDIFYYNILEESKIVCLSFCLPFHSVLLCLSSWRLGRTLCSSYRTSCLTLQPEPGKNLRIYTAVLTLQPQWYSHSPAFTVVTPQLGVALRPLCAVSGNCLEKGWLQAMLVIFTQNETILSQMVLILFLVLFSLIMTVYDTVTRNQ